MKILVIGSGGREHALVWKLAQSPHVTQMWCAPGNAGIAQERLAENSASVECASIGAEDLPKLLAFAQEKKVELTVVGPDNPLALGIVDLFQKNGLRIWGPNRKAAQFESSKVFSQNFMEKYGIPTARAGAFSEAGPAKAFATSLGGKCAVKADGLALGKGVLICTNEAMANKAIDEILVGKAFGPAGANIVIQEFLEGMEISLHAICDGKTARLFPTSQDHKRALDGDLGLNTGGMGTYSPTPFLTDAQLADTGRKILEPFMRGCAAEGIDYRGILYPGLMLTKTGPKVLEFNTRFGDPETQVYLTRLENDANLAAAKPPAFDARFLGRGEEKVEITNGEEAEKIRLALEKADWVVRSAEKKERRRNADSAVYHQQTAAGFIAQAALQRQARHDDCAAPIRRRRTRRRGTGRPDHLYANRFDARCARGDCGGARVHRQGVWRPVFAGIPEYI